MRTVKIFLPVLGMLLLACGKTPVPAPKPERPVPVKFSAVLEEMNPPSGADALSGRMTWRADDRIGVLLDDGSLFPLGLTSGAGTAEATFEGELPEGKKAGGKAVYPYLDGVYSFRDDVLQVDLPAEAALDAIPAVMTAVIDGDNLRFRHEGGVLRFTLKGIPSHAVRFRFDCGGGIYGKDSYTLIFPAGGAAERMFSVPVREGSLPGYTVSLLDAYGNALVSKSREEQTQISRRDLRILTPLRVEETDRLRLLVYNILAGMERDYDNGFDNFVAWVRSLAPDVVVLCESKAFNKSADEKNNQAYFAARIRTTASRWGHGNVSIVDRDNFPVVITSSRRMDQRAVIDNASYVSHGAVYVTVGGFNLVGLHLRPTSYAGNSATAAEYAASGVLRLRELQYILSETIDADPGSDNWIFCGDYNMYPYSEKNARSLRQGLSAYGYADVDGQRNAAYDVYDAISGHDGLRDVLLDYNGGIFMPTMYHGRSRNDYIFATGGVFARVRRAEVVRGGFPGDYRADDANPSDHMPLLMDLADYQFKVLDGVNSLADWPDESLVEEGQ